jgi:molybdate transport system permease protein
VTDLPIYLSLKVACASTLLALLAGGPIAWALAKKRFVGKALIEGITLLPLVLPPTVLGYYLLVVMSPTSGLGKFYHRITGAELSLTFNFNGIVIAACVASIPLFLRQAQVAFAEVSREIEDSARIMGASEWQVVRFITSPLARRGLIAGMALTFARSLGDFGATLMVGGNIPGTTRTLSLRVYDAWQAGEDDTAKGIALLLSAIAITIAVFASHLSKSDHSYGSP